MLDAHVGLPSIAVLGGGVAGVMSATHLARSGKWNVDLFEASDSLGGLHQSPMVDGVPFDIGAFVFSSNHGFFSTFPILRQTFVPIRYGGVALRASGTVDQYPLSVKGYLRERGLGGFVLDVADLARCKVSARRRATFRDYCRYYVGGRIYERTGLRAYVERLYALPDSEIGLELARGRLADLVRYCGLSQIASRALGLSRMRRPTSAATPFARPRGGFQEVYQHIHEELDRARVRVVTRAGLRSLARHQGRFRLVRDGEICDYDRVISTIPMGAAAALLGIELGFVPPTMQLISLFYRFRGDLGFDASTLFNYSFDGDWKRLTLFSAYYGTLDGDHYFTVECTAPESESVDLDARRQAFENHIARWPLLRGALDYRGGHVTPHAYPVYRADEESELRRARMQLEASGLILAGRQGRFDYLSSSTVAHRSRELAASIS